LYVFWFLFVFNQIGTCCLTDESTKPQGKFRCEGGMSDVI
jgi:hypothetical protein